MRSPSSVDWHAAVGGCSERTEQIHQPAVCGARGPQTYPGFGSEVAGALADTRDVHRGRTAAETLRVAGSGRRAVSQPRIPAEVVIERDELGAMLERQCGQVGVFHVVGGDAGLGQPITLRCRCVGSTTRAPGCASAARRCQGLDHHGERDAGADDGLRVVRGDGQTCAVLSPR